MKIQNNDHDDPVQRGLQNDRAPSDQVPAQLNPPMINQLYQTRLVRFTLPDFTLNDPEIWFSAVDHIFKTQNISSEEGKLSGLLQHKDRTELGHIRDIIPNQSETSADSRMK